jgi:1-acyl-sn-glycerol-3-phosphate acyltransferase
VSKILFRQCGFIPVQMADNGNGNPIVYDPASFLPLMRHCKRAFEEGFDVAIFPEGQLNPHPELGLLPVFGSAFKLARKSQRNIHMIGLYGVHRLWHPLDGMKPTSRQIKVKVYPGGRTFSSQEEFCDTFSHVVGPFGSCGEDADDLVQWLDGSAYHDQHASGVHI